MSSSRAGIRKYKGEGLYIRDMELQGDIAKALRIKGIPQKTFADMGGVARSTVSVILSGKAPCPYWLQKLLLSELGIDIGPRASRYNEHTGVIA